MQLKNDFLTLQVAEEGAELTAIQRGGENILWNADPIFWKRHSPILFPIVGRLWNDEFRVNGKIYTLSQHGFARDSLFRAIYHTFDHLILRLESSPATLAQYPFPFRLDVSYFLSGRTIEVGWEVTNLGDADMPFQIGAHPAFYFPKEGDSLGIMRFSKNGQPLTHILSTALAEKGCVQPDNKQSIPLSADGCLPLTYSLFDKDALVIENSQTNQIDLLTPSGKSYLTMRFAAPLVGLWSPPEKNAPFVCIEPWYGRCDRVGYVGEMSQRDWIGHLASGTTQRMHYSIEVAAE